LAAAARGENIIPGWRAMPELVGPVEFGSFTRYPRLGNPGTVIWRDVATRSTQNRVGLKNPGACAAAAFMGPRPMPEVYGINIAVSPGVDDAEQQRQEVHESVQAFLDSGLRPSWFTLNISCPNTEDDPHGQQTESMTASLCRAVIERVGETPVWVKVGPDLAESQYAILMRVFTETGVRAVVATNTLGQPSPDQPSVNAGVAGGRLHREAVRVAGMLQDEKRKFGYAVDVIGCGGVYNPPTYVAFASRGINVVQYWSGMIYSGPLMAAVITYAINTEIS
jgi:dihydroorotate dehydrogenase